MKKYILMAALILQAETAANATTIEELSAYGREAFATIGADHLKKMGKAFKETSWTLDYSGKVIPGINPAGTEARD